MSDKPIIFSAPMVRALLDGRKTQTRRVLKPQPEFRGGCGDWHDAEEWGWETEDGDQLSVLDIAPNGYHRGDRLWVREAHYLTDDGDEAYAIYSADAADVASHLTEMDDLKRRYPQYDWSSHLRLRPSIHMPRWASRLTLIVTDVRVQRLQDISEADAVAEGIEQDPATMAFWGADGQGVGGATTLWAHASMAFRDIWNSIHGPEAWDANPWVVALTFTVQRGNIDQIGGAA